MRNPDMNDGAFGPTAFPPGARPSSASSVVSGSGPAAAASIRSPPHYVQPLLKTPFHNRARALSQVDSFIPWAGYTTVDVFTNVEQ